MANVERYRKSYESDEHWEFRKQFLDAYYHRFSEARLLCLAQVYVNMKLMGCTYPKEVEEEVNDLVKDLPKKELKRPATPYFCKVSFVRSEDDVSAKKIPRCYPVFSNTPSSSGANVSSGDTNKDFVLLEDDFSNPYNTLNRAAQFNNSKLDIEYVDLKTQPPTFKCLVILDGQQIGEGTGCSKVESRENAVNTALENLRPKVNVVKIKDSMYKDKVSHNNLVDLGKTEKIGKDNVGFKLLQMMGWKGGAIGKGESIPIGVKDMYKGQGLGYKPPDKLRPCHIRTFLVNYMNSNSTADLVFSADFTKEERATIHRIASQLKLRSQSKGSEGVDRHLIISRKFTPSDLLRLLKESGGSTDKYELIPPTTTSIFT